MTNILIWCIGVDGKKHVRQVDEKISQCGMPVDTRLNSNTYPYQFTCGQCECEIEAYYENETNKKED